MGVRRMEAKGRWRAYQAGRLVVFVLIAIVLLIILLQLLDLPDSRT